MFLLGSVALKSSKLTFLKDIQLLIVEYITGRFLLTILCCVKRSQMNMAMIFIESLCENDYFLGSGSISKNQVTSVL